MNTLRIVETKVGNGSHAKEFTFTNHLGEIPDFFLSPEQLKDVLNLRKLIVEE